MAPRGRDRKNLDLTGTNIKPIKRRWGFDYYYTMPDGSLKPIVDAAGVKATRAEAIEAAHQLNALLRPSGNIVNAIIDRPARTPAKSLDNLNLILEQALAKPAKPFKVGEATLKEKLFKVAQYKRMWGERSISGITTQDIAEFLDKQTDHAYVKHRQLLKDIFAFAIQRGFIQLNPVDQTEKKSEPKRVRQRHTIEGYQQIYNTAPAWLQRAMKIALLSLQRRGDLVNLHRDSIDMQERTITVLQQKTRNYARPIYIKIKMGDELYTAVKDCLSSGIPCPYLIHYRPVRMTTQVRQSKTHPFAVSLDHLTKSFSDTRDKCGAYNQLPPGQRPTLHDLRALGSYLYKKAGYPIEYIQALDGHADTSTTERYIDGHEAKKPVIVHADLSISDLKSS